ncbi:MAG: IPT/TIG domain-containing protein [Micropruina sp.]|uniref:IPT/TIG domain-containing protein n=1 Tax=Micropruina sp. TaxID=2737536 RepID=UPI0039E3DE05
MTALTPARGPVAGRTQITVTGSGFTGAKRVLFGWKTGWNLKVLTDTRLTVTAPPGWSTVGVRVVTDRGISKVSEHTRYRYVAAPRVFALRPDSAGTDNPAKVTIVGDNFLDVSTVMFGNSAGTDLRVWSEHKLTVTTPPREAGTTTVRVITAYGSSKSGRQARFTFVASPRVSGISPTTGPAAGGTTVTVVGLGFSTATRVTFGGTPAANLKVLTDRKLTVTAPAGQPGTTADVVVTGRYGSSKPHVAARYSYASTCVPTVVPVSGTIAADTTWQPAGCGTVYRVSGTVTVAKSATLTVAAGTVVKFDGQASMSVDGSLVVEGTTAAPAVFTGIRDDSLGGDTNGDGSATSPKAGDWGSIRLNDDAILRANALTVRYGSGIDGSGVAGQDADLSVFELTDSTLSHNTAGVVAYHSDENVDPERAITITGTTLVDSGTIAVSSMGSYNAATPNDVPVPVQVSGNSVSGATSAQPAYSICDGTLQPSLLTGNTGSDNTVNAIRLCGTLVEDWALPTTGLPYIMGSLKLGGIPGFPLTPRATLTIPAGAIVKFDDGARLDVTDGSLIVNGTQTQPVIFTSIHDDDAGGDTNGNGNGTSPEPGSWGGLSVSSSNYSTDTQTYNTTGTLTANELDQRYSSGITSSSAAGFRLTNSTLSDNSGGITADRSLWMGFSVAGEIVIVGNTLTSSGGISVESYPPDPRLDGYATAVQVTGNHVTGNTTDQPAYFYSEQDFDPASLSSNTGSDNKVNAIGISGRIGSWTVPTTGLQYVVSGPVTVLGTLTVPAGAVLKFAGSLEIGYNGALVANGTADTPAVFTSIRDDSVRGDTNGDGNATSPQAGDWGGVMVTGLFNAGRGQIANGPASITVTGLTLRYGRGIVSAPGVDTTFRVTNSDLVDNAAGLFGDGGIFVLRAGPGATTITGNTLTRSGTVQVETTIDEQDAGPLEVADNTINP